MEDKCDPYHLLFIFQDVAEVMIDQPVQVRFLMTRLKYNPLLDETNENNCAVQKLRSV